jgi:hypothetical protein
MRHINNARTLFTGRIVHRTWYNVPGCKKKIKPRENLVLNVTYVQKWIESMSRIDHQ